jgi:hypothetical protein
MCLRLLLLSKSAIVEDARGFDSGRFALLVDFPPVASGQQLIRAKVRGFPARPSKETARWLREP